MESGRGGYFYYVKEQVKWNRGRPLSAVSTSFPVLKSKLNGIGRGALYYVKEQVKWNREGGSLLC